MAPSVCEISESQSDLIGDQGRATADHRDEAEPRELFYGRASNTAPEWRGGAAGRHDRATTRLPSSKTAAALAEAQRSEALARMVCVNKRRDSRGDLRSDSSFPTTRDLPRAVNARSQLDRQQDALKLWLTGCRRCAQDPPRHRVNRSAPDERPHLPPVNDPERRQNEGTFGPLPRQARASACASGRDERRGEDVPRSHSRADPRQAREKKMKGG